MKKRKRYTGNFKAQVVAEYIKGEKSLDEIADEHQVHPNQIKNWKSLLFKRAHEVLEDRRSPMDNDL
jgi:transposase